MRARRCGMTALGKKSLDKVRREGDWQPMDNYSTVAWFGGKSHTQLSTWLPDGALEESNFEDIDFLVIGWRKAE